MPIRIPDYGPTPSSSSSSPRGVNLKGINPGGVSIQGINASDAVKPALALARVAESSGGAIAQQLAEHDLRVMESENAADLTEFKTAAKTAYAQRVATFAEDHDYKSYGQAWDKDIEGLQKTLTDGGFSQSTTDRAKLWLESFAGDTRISVAATAQNKAIKRSKDATVNALDLVEQNFNPANPGASILEVEDHLADSPYTPEEKDRVRQTMGKRIDAKAREIDEQDFMEMLEADPASAGDLLDDEFIFSTFDAADRMRFKSMAKRKTIERKSEGFEDIRNGVITGDLDEAGIMVQAEQMNLTPEETEKAVKFRNDFLKAEAEAGPLDWAKVFKLEQDIDALDEASMTKEAYAREWGKLYDRAAIEAVGDDGKGGQIQGGLKQKLWGKNPVLERRKVDLPEGVESELGRIIAVERNLGTWGQLKDDEGNPDPVATRAAVEAENNLRRQIKLELEKNPEQFRQPGAIQEWFNAKLGGQRAGQAVRQWTGATGALFPSDAGTTDSDPDLSKQILRYRR